MLLAGAILIPQSTVFAETMISVDGSVRPVLATEQQERAIGGISIFAAVVSNTTVDASTIRVYRLETKTESDGTYRFSNLSPKSVYTVSFANTAPFQKKEVGSDGLIVGKITKDMVNTISLCPPSVKPFVKNIWDSERVLQLKDVLKNQGVLSARAENNKTPRVEDMKKDIIKFQKKYNIPATGFIGDITVKKLNDVVSRGQIEDIRTSLGGTSNLPDRQVSGSMVPFESTIMVPPCNEPIQPTPPITKPVVRPVVNTETANRSLLDTICGVLGYNSYKMECNEVHKPELNQPNLTAINTPRVMFWQGKVNQHWNIDLRRFETDVDGVSGATSDILGYCKKMYPRTTRIEPYKEEVSQTWAERGNRNNYMYSFVSTLCLE